MAENKSNAPVGYGYADDTVRVNTLKFGLNSKTYLTRFEYTPTGGKDGAQQDALDIIFNINGTDKSYRMFPVVRAFDRNNQEVTDPTAPEFGEAMVDFNARVNHILHCFIEKDYAKAKMSRPFADFKEYAQFAASLLPKGFDKKELDVFLNWQWQISEGRDKTYLEFPKKMKQGAWVCVHRPGTWKEVRVENPDDGEGKALKYVNEKGEEHPFTRTGWFLNHEFGYQQGVKPTGTAQSEAAAAMNAPASVVPQEPAAENGTPAVEQQPTAPPAVW